MRVFYLIFCLCICCFKLIGQNEYGYFTKNGAWCWFSDPRAILVDDYIVAGWVKSNGSIEAGRLHIGTKKIESDILYHKLEKDDHNNPSFIMINDRKLLAMYAQHNQKHLYTNTLHDFSGAFKFSETKKIYPIDKTEYRKFRVRKVTYANLSMLKNENNRLYSFGRWTGFKPNVMWSDDAGLNWSKARVFVTKRPFNKKNRPYVKYVSDGISKIHMVFTDGHPSEEPLNGVYYAYFKGGAFYSANGQKISSIENLPFEIKDASVVYAPETSQARAWISDIAQDNLSNPVILFTKSPNEKNHEYWYARYVDDTWVVHKICDSGKWFPKPRKDRDVIESYYFGNMTLHPDNVNVVYLSREIEGVFEIERWETNDLGETWQKESITSNSKYDNVRPFVPRGLKSTQDEILLWMENKKYRHFTNYKTAIKYFVRK